MASYILSKQSDQIRKAIQSSPSIKVFAFSGYKGSGKSHYANAFQNEINTYNTEVEYRVQDVTSFADSLKSTVSDLFDIPEDYFYNSKLKETIISKYNKTPRQLLQWFGTEIMQTEFARFLGYSDRLLWVNKCIFDKVEYMFDVDGSYINIIIIDDLRFAHEQAALIDYFGRNSVAFIRVVNTKVSPPTDEEKAALHVSETEHESLEFDWIIDNDMTEINLPLIADIFTSVSE